MYKFSYSGKDIARGDDMKKPNNVLNKKYISSLVIAAFLILSVLTAYNIKVGNHGSEDSTEAEETIGNNDDIISSGDARLGEEEKNDMEETKENSTSDDVEEETKESASDETKYENSVEENTGETFHYDGKTKLKWPVVGNVILPYSMDTTVYYTTLDQYACNDGILIGAKKGDKVRAAAAGRVVNISDDDRYGKMVTILIGDYYEVSYAQLENVKLEVGEEVEEGEVIANVADPTRTFTLEGPHLFFKMTYKGEPVNPANYLEA